MLMITYPFIFFLAGALGALTQDIIEGNSITFPKKIGDTLHLGFLGGIVVGGLAGYLIDGQFITAFIAGYSGTSIIEGLIGKPGQEEPEPCLTIEEIIRKVATREMVDCDLAVRVAKCESGLNPKAINTNTDGSKDRGIFQINDKWHPDVSDEQAFDPYFSAEFFCKAFKSGKLEWWKATKHCWDK